MWIKDGTEGPLCSFHAPHRVGSDKNKRSSHVLWIGTDRDPFVFALSSCSGVRLVETSGEGAIALVVRQHKRLKDVKISKRPSNISDICSIS